MSDETEALALGNSYTLMQIFHTQCHTNTSLCACQKLIQQHLHFVAALHVNFCELLFQNCARFSECMNFCVVTNRVTVDQAFVKSYSSLSIGLIFPQSD